MTVYNTGVFRTGQFAAGGAGTGSDPLVPEPVSNQILQELPNSSLLLQRARQVPMGTKTYRMPVLDALPQAYFVGGDTGLEQTTDVEWKNLFLVAEEIAAIVPIPLNYLEDTDIDVWGEVRPRLVAALGALIDKAGVWGIGTPNTWSNPIYQSAISAGNSVTNGANNPNTGHAFTDDAQAVSYLGELLAEQGYAVDGFGSRPGYTWKLSGMRSEQGIPIFQPNLAGGPGGTLLGYGLSEVKNGSWQRSEADLIAGDFSKAIVGLRQDMSFTLHTEGVISNDAGAVVLNLMQQKSAALQVNMRVAFCTANPVTELAGKTTPRSPFAVLHPTGFVGS
jgi:HK97 family phage major capsid protein